MPIAAFISILVTLFGAQIEVNPQTTTISARGLFTGLATTAGAGYRSHHPTSFKTSGSFCGGQFIFPSHHQQTKGLNQIQH